ncbi:hypothetical protein QZM46_16305 [Burkholderia vietnamiensis]|uniref:hypothetical protein n=1 Tax=Burkholderia vietnamiensis TaxID=60552 RepID=UPI00264E3E61|nr:hypothetical protein [Burkholderia vietnamiensis]MDN7552883.1 hypothetical protein [Burkholderia vietnamiensis]HDR9093072.1 hypothetical protein [Burkholderia vietnamiensis]
MNEDEREKYSPVKDEMYHLLLCAYCYVRKLDNLENRLRSESREFLLEEITALRHLSNGIILHLCNLDDDSSKWSMRSLRKDLEKTSTFKNSRKASDLLGDYRNSLQKFKTKHRNLFIAHRNGEHYPDPFSLPDYRTEFKELIGAALSTLECLWGAELKFGFNLGSRDPTINFREVLGF